MKDTSKEVLENSRPKIDPYKAINFCLTQLYNDSEKNITDEIVENLTYEELIGALLLAIDIIESDREECEEDCKYYPDNHDNDDSIITYF